jgi:hypothetical protein
MSVRQPLLRLRVEPAQSPPSREVSLPVVAGLIGAAALGLAAWRFSSTGYARGNQRGYRPRHAVAWTGLPAVDEAAQPAGRSGAALVVRRKLSV